MLYIVISCLLQQHNNNSNNNNSSNSNNSNNNSNNSNNSSNYVQLCLSALGTVILNGAYCLLPTSALFATEQMVVVVAVVVVAVVVADVMRNNSGHCFSFLAFQIVALNTDSVHDCNTVRS